jgi:hypothetical protein
MVCCILNCILDFVNFSFHSLSGCLCCSAKDVRQVYEIMVENCMGITTQDMQIPFYVLNKLEHPELHERSYPVQALFRHLSKLTKVCGVRDFNVTDITSPDPKRTLFILSAIMNFEKFRVDRLTHFASYQDEAVRFFSVNRFVVQLTSQWFCSQLQDALAEARDQSGERLNLVSKRMESVRYVNLLMLLFLRHENVMLCCSNVSALKSKPRHPWPASS